MTETPPGKRTAEPPAAAGPRDRAQGDFTLALSIGAHVKRTQRLFSQALQFYLAPHDIPIGMWYFLRALWDEDGLSQREISQRVGATAATATEQLKNMELRGLVTRRLGRTDRRRVHFHLTEAGWKLHELLIHIPREVERIALAGLSAGEVGFFRLALIRIEENLLKHETDVLHVGHKASPPLDEA